MCANTLQFQEGTCLENPGWNILVAQLIFEMVALMERPAGSIQLSVSQSLKNDAVIGARRNNEKWIKLW